MTTIFSLKKLFFGILILVLAGVVWISMQTCQKTGTGLKQASDNAPETPGKIGDTAAELIDKTVPVARERAKSAGSIIDKTAEKAAAAYGAAAETIDKVADKAKKDYQAAGDMAAKAADKAGEPSSLKVGEMAENAADKAGEAYRAAGDMAGNTAEETGEDLQSDGVSAKNVDVESGKALLAAAGSADKGGENAEMASVSTDTKKENDSVSEGGENTKGQLVEVAAKYKAEGVGNASLPAAKGPIVTVAGTWLYEDFRFDYNRSDLNPGALASMKELAATLKARPELNVEIQGHTDSSGARDYNLELSRRRAQNVKAYLESQGIAPSRMIVKGFGPDRPRFSNASEEDSAKNRRVEIKPLN